MALGNPGIQRLSEQNNEIISSINFGNEQAEGIYSVWNTFNYVAKNLSIWADETIIGANIKQNINQLSNSLYDLMNSTNRLNDKISAFIVNQKTLNSGSNYPGKQYEAGDLSAFPLE